MLYRITLYTPDPSQPCYNATRSEIVGTPRVADLRATEWLPPAFETDYSARVTRQPFVKVEPVRRWAPYYLPARRAELRACGSARTITPCWHCNPPWNRLRG